MSTLNRSKSNLPGAVLRAQAVLEFMIRSDPKDGISPDVISFASVMNALVSTMSHIEDQYLQDFYAYLLAKKKVSLQLLF